MPFKSRKQWAWMFWATKKGKIKRGVAKRWAKHTKRKFKSLPLKVRKRRKGKKRRRRR